MLDGKIKELIAVGASVAANCQSCVRYHLGKARDMRIAEDDIRQAVDVGKTVRKGAAGEMDTLIADMSERNNL